MEKNKINTEKNDITKFAFLPEMVLEHLNDAKTTTPETIKEEIFNSKVPQTIIFDPLAEPFDGSIIEIEPTLNKKKTKSIKTNNKPKLEPTPPKLIIAENKIIQFVKKIKFNFFNF